MKNIFEDLKIGDEVNSDYISQKSKINRVRGIHTIKNNMGYVECVAILCTINGNSYPNEWIEKNDVLKYYFFGIKTSKDIKVFSAEYKDNRAIIESKGKYPIYTFVRNNKKEKFKFEGEFKLLDIGSDIDGAMYFILSKASIKNSNLSLLKIEESENFPEGRRKERLHKFNERNPKVIKKAKEKFKEKFGSLYCEICGFNFENVYGDLGKDYIEGHHTKPVSELEEGEHTSVKDILLVCSNCHRMLHKKRPCLAKLELINLIKKHN